LGASSPYGSECQDAFRNNSKEWRHLGLTYDILDIA